MQQRLFKCRTLRHRSLSHIKKEKEVVETHGTTTPTNDNCGFIEGRLANIRWFMIRKEKGWGKNLREGGKPVICHQSHILLRNACCLYLQIF